MATSRLRPATSVPSETRTRCPATSTTSPRPENDRDLAAAQQRLDALGEAVDDLLLARLGAVQVERRQPDVDPEVARAEDGAQHLGRLQQLLGRDAAAVEAGAADAVLLDQRDVEPGGGAVERRGVARGATAQHHEIVQLVLGQRGHLPRAGLSVPARCRPRGASPGVVSAREPAGFTFFQSRARTHRELIAPGGSAPPRRRGWRAR